MKNGTQRPLTEGIKNSKKKKKTPIKTIPFLAFSIWIYKLGA